MQNFKMLPRLSCLSAALDAKIYEKFYGTYFALPYLKSLLDGVSG